MRDKLSELKKDKKCTNLKQYQRVYGVVHGINDYLYELEGWGNVNMDYAYWHMARSSWKVEYIVENEKIGLRFVEDFYYCPGRIEPKIQFEYKDQDGKPLEKQAGEIIYRLFLESGRALQFKELGVRREKKRKAEEARARKLAPYIEAEDKKAKRALDDAKAYKNAILIREYAETYRERHNQEFSEKPELKDYYLWLLARADWLDPLIENDYDALLEDAVAKE